jgi:hypothetical protein
LRDNSSSQLQNCKRKNLIVQNKQAILRNLGLNICVVKNILSMVENFLSEQLDDIDPDYGGTAGLHVEFSPSRTMLIYT